jgi:hypothetical protein
VPEELRQYAEEDIAMRVGTFKYKRENGRDRTNNCFLIKHEGVTMLWTDAYDKPSSGCFKLNNSTELQINCDKSNWLNLGYYYSIFGVSEHLDKIADAGF